MFSMSTIRPHAEGWSSRSLPSINFGRLKIVAVMSRQKICKFEAGPKNAINNWKFLWNKNWKKKFPNENLFYCKSSRATICATCVNFRFKRWTKLRFLFRCSRRNRVQIFEWLKSQGPANAELPWQKFCAFSLKLSRSIFDPFGQKKIPARSNLKHRRFLPIDKTFFSKF